MQRDRRRLRFLTQKNNGYGGGETSLLAMPLVFWGIIEPFLLFT